MSLKTVFTIEKVWANGLPFIYFTIYTCAKNSVWKIEKSISNKIKNRSKNTYKQMELIEMMLQEIQKSQQKPKVN